MNTIDGTCSRMEPKVQPERLRVLDPNLKSLLQSTHFMHKYATLKKNNVFVFFLGQECPKFEKTQEKEGKRRRVKIPKFAFAANMVLHLDVNLEFTLL